MEKLDNLSSDFVLSIVTEKNMSLNTAASYEADLKIFFSFMKVQNLGIASIRKTNITKFFQIQREKGFLRQYHFPKIIYYQTIF